MGFLIFAYRKLFLKNRISDLQFKSMLLSMKQQKITEQIANVQEGMASAKNMVSVFTNNAMAQLNQQMLASGQNADGTQNTQALNPQLYAQMQAQQYQIAAQSNACNSVFEGAVKAQLSQLNAQDKQIQTQMASIDSQTKQLSAELEGVEKGESDAAKKAAPTFGYS